MKGLTLTLLLLLTLTSVSLGKKHFFLAPVNTTIRTGEKLTLRVMVTTDGDSLPSPEMASPKESGAFTWAINEHVVNSTYKGPEGELLPGGGMATYIAPVAIPAKNPVQVSVKVPGEEGTAFQILIATIKIVDSENSWVITSSDCVPNDTYIPKISNLGSYGSITMSSAFATYNKAENVMMVSISGPVENLTLPPSMILWINGRIPGHYTWKIFKKNEGSKVPECGLALTVPVDAMNIREITSVDCKPAPDGSCQPYSLMGFTDITEIRDDQIKGFFSGRVMWGDSNGERHFMEVAGNFKAQIQDFGGVH